MLTQSGATTRSTIIPATSPQGVSGRVLAAESSAVAVVMAVIYLLTLAGSHNEGEDGVGYLLPIRDGDVAGIFNPYHLMYNWLGWTAYHTARTFGFEGGPMGPMQVLNALLGATGVALLWALLRSAARDRVTAAAGCGLLAFAYGYWAYSVDVEVYVLSAVLLLVALIAAWRATLRPSAQAFALLGAANGFAVLGHNTNVLFGIVALTALAIASRTRPIRQTTRFAFAYGAGATAVVVPLYALAIPFVGLRSPREFYDWLTAYAQSGDWGHWSAQSGPKAVVGVARAVIGGHFALSLSPLRHVADDRFRDKSLREEFFMVRNYHPILAAMLIALSGVAVLGIGSSAARWLRRPALPEPAANLALLCLAWIVPYAVFFTWWEPANLEFWIASLIPLAILVVLPLASPATGRWARIAPRAIALAIACLLAVNLLGSVGPQRRATDDYWRVRTRWYEKNASPNDLVFTSGYIFTEYLRYFSKAQVVDVNNEITLSDGPDRVVGEMERRLEAAPGARVLFSSELFFPGDDAFSHCSEPACSVGKTVREVYLARSQLIDDSGLEAVWELRR